MTTQTNVPMRAVMNALPMFVLPLNNLITMKITIVEITRPITKITAGLSISNDAIINLEYHEKASGTFNEELSKGSAPPPHAH